MNLQIHKIQNGYMVYLQTGAFTLPTQIFCKNIIQVMAAVEQLLESTERKPAE